MLAILVVCGADFRAPSEKQALWLAGALGAAGHRVLISLGGDPVTARAEGAEAVPGLRVVGHRLRGRSLGGDEAAAARDFAPDVVYALNARLPVVTAARAYARVTGAPVFVHFEDDEWGLRRAPDGLPAARRAVRRCGARARRGPRSVRRPRRPPSQGPRRG